MLLAAVLATFSFFMFINKSVGTYDVVSSTVIFAALLFLLQRLSVWQVTHPRLQKIDAALGDLTYPLYLNHYVICIILAAFFPKSMLLFAVGILIAVVVSNIAYLLIEPRMKKRRDKIRGRVISTDSVKA